MHLDTETCGCRTCSWTAERIRLANLRKFRSVTKETDRG